MGKIFKTLIFLGIIFVIVVLVILGYFLFKQPANNNIQTPSSETKEASVTELSVKSADFSKINSEFLFSAEIPKEFEVEYVSSLRAINIYDPSLPGKNNTESSQIYISYFSSSRFLTLNTVDITQRDQMIIKGREAILYEIAKKPTVPNFAGQPTWRNFKHKALDIRFSNASPTHFYSFAYNPNLPEKVFNDFINSLIFIQFL